MKKPSHKGGFFSFCAVLYSTHYALYKGGAVIHFSLYLMSEAHHEHEGRPSRSAHAKLFMGKIIAHPIFSDRVLYWVLLGLTFLLPLFFIPGQIVAPEFAKMLLLEGVVLVAIFSFAIGRLREGKIEVPKSYLLLVSALLLVQFVVSAIMSSSPVVSFIGSGYDLGTVSAFATLFLLMFLASVVFVERSRILALFAVLTLSSLVLMLYHILRQIFGVEFLDFGIFTNAVSTPVGKWNDLASLVGLFMVLILVTQYFFPLPKALRIFGTTSFVLGLMVLLSVNFTVLWWVLGAVTLCLCVLAFIEGEAKHRKSVHEATHAGVIHHTKPIHHRVVRHLPKLTFLLLVVSVIYVTGISNIQIGKNNRSISSVVARALHATEYSEVILSQTYTFDIVKQTLKQSPFFGVGPNRFATAYLTTKTSSMNHTPYWDTTFEFGSGRIPTYFGTTGLIGMVLWLIFFMLIFMKVRKIRKFFETDRMAAYLVTSLFLLVLYFWALAFFYLPNITIFTLAFIFTGALIGLLVGEGVLDRVRVSFNEKSPFALVMTPLVIIILVGTLAASMLMYRQVASLAAFRDAQLAANGGNVFVAKSALQKANKFAERDVYHRALSNVALFELTELARQNLSQEEWEQKAKSAMDEARAEAERAVTLDPMNFENYVQLGGVYNTFGTLGIQGALPLARENYLNALELNPKSPRILFLLARLESALGDREKTKDYLYKALSEHPNYLDAVGALVQLELQDKNPEAAIRILSAGLGEEPTNFVMHFSLGYLFYMGQDYNHAGGEFLAAVTLNPAYADARYFLGLTYVRVGDIPRAIEEFTQVQLLNPDNDDVAKILTNLRAGRDPFAPPYTAPLAPVTNALNNLEKGSK